MKTTKLFETKDVKRFFTILEKLERSICDNYTGYDRKGSTRTFCQREIFVKRTLNKWFKDRVLILYKESEQTRVEYKQYISISSISYALTWGIDLEVYFYDYAKPVDIYSSMTLDHNKVLELEGEWSKKPTLHNQILNLTYLNIPLKEYSFKAYDFSKYPKRKKKGETGEQIREKLKTIVTVTARTEKEAYKKMRQMVKDTNLYIVMDIVGVKKIPVK